MPGEHDDRKAIERTLRPHKIEYLPAVHVWKTDVKEEYVRGRFEQALAYLRTVCDGLNQDVQPVERDLYETTDDMAVINSDDMLHADPASDRLQFLHHGYRHPAGEP